MQTLQSDSSGERLARASPKDGKLLFEKKPFSPAKTPSFIPGQRCPENLEISIITDVRFSNFNNSELVKDINELLSYSKNLVF